MSTQRDATELRVQFSRVESRRVDMNKVLEMRSSAFIPVDRSSQSRNAKRCWPPDLLPSIWPFYTHTYNKIISSEIYIDLYFRIVGNNFGIFSDKNYHNRLVLENLCQKTAAIRFLRDDVHSLHTIHSHMIVRTHRQTKSHNISNSVPKMINISTVRMLTTKYVYAPFCILYFLVSCCHFGEIKFIYITEMRMKSADRFNFRGL